MQINYKRLRICVMFLSRLFSAAESRPLGLFDSVRKDPMKNNADCVCRKRLAARATTRLICENSFHIHRNDLLLPLTLKLGH
jgi:hypothetical protein